MNKIDKFIIRDCALVVLATGKRAQNLRELRDFLHDVSRECIYYHFWSGLLRPRFQDPEYHNDFSVWAAHSLHDKELAEKLAIINPTDFSDLDDLRNEVIDILEEALDNVEYPPWVKSDAQFEFVKSQIVVFNTNRTANNPEELKDQIAEMSAGSIFFHFIDAQRRNENSADDFSNWLVNFGDEYQQLIRQIDEIDPYFAPLTKLRTELSKVFENYFNTVY
ncbi:MAG: hypothetical protein GF315_14120 [candidate division Zixibacteria bacterium]|nr:hypothetical protein [candidate division Zixibacteria bacterium]